MVFKIGCKVTAFLLYTQVFFKKNTTNFCQNVTKNRLPSCIYEKKAVPLHPKFKQL